MEGCVYKEMQDADICTVSGRIGVCNILCHHVMPNFPVPRDPDALQKSSVYYYALSQQRKGTKKPLSFSLNADENFALSVQMYDAQERDRLHLLHRCYLKMMRKTEQIPVERVYIWPPERPKKLERK